MAHFNNVKMKYEFVSNSAGKYSTGWDRRRLGQGGSMPYESSVQISSGNDEFRSTTQHLYFMQGIRSIVAFPNKC